ncbi:MAG: hypothetical protein DRI90_22135 [Deltaproteobacteria bacterium]|nr:MAG: hypothetical protein DRI90_22135 [Deltaproteobacteria bacterium]
MRAHPLENRFRLTTAPAPRQRRAGDRRSGALHQRPDRQKRHPDTEPDQAAISICAPDGTDLEETDRIVRELEAILASEENVDIFVIETGVAGGRILFGNQAAANQARITVDFLKHRTKAAGGDKVRVENSRTTITRIREKASQIAGATILVDKLEMGHRWASPSPSRGRGTTSNRRARSPLRCGGISPPSPGLPI